MLKYSKCAGAFICHIALLLLGLPQSGLAQDNMAPVLPPVGNQQVNELNQLTVVQTATESDNNATLSYSLLSPPAGATISADGIFTWTPSQAQSPGTYLITVVATSTDTNDPVNPEVSAENGFYVTVSEVNVAPVLPVLSNQTMAPAMLLSVINTATDSNIHDTLSYRLVGPPAGAAIDANGIISWLPSLAQADTTNLLTTVVTANNSKGAPPSTATNSFNVIVTESANVFTWTNRLGGSWSFLGNWSPNGVPGPGDTAYIPYFAGTNPTVMVYTTTTVGNLTLGGSSGSLSPTLGGPASLVVTGLLSWQGGTIQGVVQSGGGTLNGTSYLDGGHLLNTGALAWNDALLNDGAGSVISNAPGATVNLTVNGPATAAQYTGGATFANAGNLNVMNSVVLTDSFDNTGTGIVTVISGVFNLKNGGANAGSISVIGNAMLDFSGGTFSCASASSVSGPITINGAHVNVAGSGFAPSVLTMTVGTLTNSVPVLVGELDWSGGTVDGVVQCDAGNVSGDVSLPAGQLINISSLTWSGLINGGAGSIISNAPSAVINLSSTNGQLGTLTSGAFYNAGQLNVWAGVGPNEAAIQDLFVNSGIVNVYSGELALSNGTNSNTINEAANATLQLTPGNIFTCTSGSYLNCTNNLLVGSASGTGTVNLAGTVTVFGTNIFSGVTVNVTGNYPLTTPVVITAGAGVKLNGTGALTPPLLTMNSGSLTSSVPLMAEQLNWTAGVIYSVIQCNGGMAGGECSLAGGQLINTGMLGWTGVISDRSGSVISNAPTGVINLNGTNGQVGTVSSAPATFYNAGQLNVSAGLGPSEAVIADLFVNSGIVAVETGALILENGTNSNTITEAGNATLQFADGTFTCTSGSYLYCTNDLVLGGLAVSAVNLAGTVIVTGTNLFTGVTTVNVTGNYPLTSPVVISDAQVNLNGTGALTPPVLTMSQGTLTNTLPLLVGQLDWSGGTIYGMVECNSGNLSGVAILSGGKLINTGTLALTGVIDDGNGSVISNAPNATINVSYNPDSLGHLSSGDGSSVVWNAGQFNVSAGTNVVSIIDPFINTGTVSVNSGFFNLQYGGTNFGTITVATNATLQFSLPFSGDSGVSFYFTFTCAVGSRLSITNNLLIGGGVPDPPGPILYGGPGTYTVLLGGTVNVAGTNIFGFGEPYTSFVNVTGDYPITTPVVFSGGAVVALNGTGALSPTVLAMGSGTLTNTTPMLAGSLNWSGGTLQGVVQCNGGTWTNGPCNLESGQLINLGVLLWSNAVVHDGAGSVISNGPTATINLKASGPVTQLSYGGSASFDNAGQFNITAGASAATLADAFTNSGTLSLNGGTFSPSALFKQTAGLTLLNGGNLNNSQPFQLQGGTLAGSGAIDGSVTNGGTVSPGNPLGEMTIGGNYVQTSNGALDIALAGTMPGSSFDLLVVTNTATLAGSLNVALTNGFYPTNNAMFAFLNAKSRSGTFGNFFYPSNSVGLQVNYAASSASLQATNVRPYLAPIPNFGVNPGQAVSYTLTATDSVPSRVLTFNLGSGPGGIGPSSGLYNWRPPVAAANTSNNVVVSVTDDSIPPLSNSTNFSILVNPLAPLTLSGLSYSHGQFSMMVTGTLGPDYIIEASTNFSQWQPLETNASPTLPFEFTDPLAAQFGQRFYRVQLSP